jgi:hypothetical protein
MSETGYPTVGLATNEETQGYYFARLLFEGFLYLYRFLGCKGEAEKKKSMRGEGVCLLSL